MRNAARDDPRRRQQVGSRVMLEAARRSRGRPPARGRRAALHAEGGGRAARRRAFDHARLRPSRLRLRPGCADRRGDARRAEARTMHVRFHGRAAHSGIAPEEGRSAIAAAARAVADLRLGRLDEDTTANVGTIRGGRAQHRPGVVRPRGGGAFARRARSSPTWCRRCSTHSPSPQASRTARSRRR